MKISGLSSVPGSVLATEYQREIIYSATVLLTWNCQVWHMLKENLFMCPRQTAVAAGLTWEEARQVLEQHLPTRWGTSVRATLHKVSHFSLNWKIKAQVAVLGGKSVGKFCSWTDLCSMCGFPDSRKKCRYPGNGEGNLFINTAAIHATSM